MRKLLWISPGVVLCVLGSIAWAQAQSSPSDQQPFCEKYPALCTETLQNVDYEGNYVGHDEPALLFYSNRPGSGNSNIYFITLPKDPPTLPRQDGTGGTFNFQLRPAFWFGMAMCDSESSPNFTKVCEPNTDANIFDDPNPASPTYIGKHPGTAFMEMQFYPPGWLKWPFSTSCDGTRWCAALNIDSLSANANTGQNNNRDCLRKVGIEPVNFAFISKTGVPVGPPDPLNRNLSTVTPDPDKVLLMNPGDTLRVILRDTPAGFQVAITDLTTGESGFMSAGAANGFGQIVFDPDTDPLHPKSCQVRAYDFHPMYATSSEHTRVPWAAHSFNVAFSDEIGHFESCENVTPLFTILGVPIGICTVRIPNDGLRQRDPDDFPCFLALSSSRVPINGCTGTDVDFDGVPYQKVWPGSLTSTRQDRLLNSRPVRFTSPLFFRRDEDEGNDGDGGKLRNYDRVAFEADLPRIEFATNPPCNRLSGGNCTNPPKGASFYPFYTTAESPIAGGQCVWQLGGANIPGTTNLFGGSSTTAFGPLLSLRYAGVGGSFSLFNNFRNVLEENPCRVDIDEMHDRGDDRDGDKDQDNRDKHDE